MKLATAFYTAALLLVPGVGIANPVGVIPPNDPDVSTTYSFPMVVSPGAKNCLPDAQGAVIDHTFGNVENMSVIISGLPANTDFVLFIIQVPNAPFGLAWYNGDIMTDADGKGFITLSGGSILGHSSFLLVLCPHLMFSQHRPRSSPNQRRAR